MTDKFLVYMLSVYERIVCKERTWEWKIITQRTRKIQSLTDIDINQYIQADLQWTEIAQKSSSRSFTCLSTCFNPNAYFSFLYSLLLLLALSASFVIRLVFFLLLRNNNNIEYIRWYEWRKKKHERRFGLMLNLCFFDIDIRQVFSLNIEKLMLSFMYFNLIVAISVMHLSLSCQYVRNMIAWFDQNTIEKWKKK